MLKSFAKRLGFVTVPDLEQVKADAIRAVQSDLPEFISAYNAANEWNVPQPERYEAQASLMAKVAYLYTVVTLTAQSAAKQDFDVYIDGKEIENTNLEKILKSPNPMQTGFEFLRDHFTYILLNKQSYWWLNRTTANDEPSEIWIIPPGNIQAQLDEKLGIKEYWYFPGDGQTVVIPTYQILWFKGFHPSNMYASLSPVEPLNMTIQTDLDTQKFLRTVYGKNSGRLPGIIAFKSPVNDDDWKKIKQDVVSKSAEGSYMLLRGAGEGVTWLQAASSLNEMETLQGRRMTREDIYNAIAPGLYNMTDVSATEANAKVGKETFAEFTLLPLFIDTAQKINKELAIVYGDKLTLEFDNPVPRDVALEMAETEQYSRFASVNEVRVDKLNLLPLPPTDPRGALFVAQVSANVAPVQTAQETAPAQSLSLPTAEENAIAAELQDWQKFAEKRFGQKGGRRFEPRVIPPALAVRVSSALVNAKNADDLPAIFANAAQELPAIVLAMAINRAAHE